MTQNVHTFQEIPHEILQYDGKLKSLDVGIVGKSGALTLELKKNSEGKTIVSEQFSYPPLFTQRALYYEIELPSMAFLQIMSSSGGIVQGDRYQIDISLKNNAIVNLTTQGATRIYKMNTNFAAQSVDVSVDKGCYFEFIPDQLILYKNSRYFQQMNLQVHDNATMLYSEIIVPGRISMNEIFDFDTCFLKTIAMNQEKKLRFVDTTVMEPKKQKMIKSGLFGNKSIVGTVYIITKQDHVLEFTSEINSLIKKSGLIGGTSIMPKSSGVITRIIDDDSNKIKDFVYDIVKLTRKKILDAPFTGIRKS